MQGSDSAEMLERLQLRSGPRSVETRLQDSDEITREYIPYIPRSSR